MNTETWIEKISNRITHLQNGGEIDKNTIDFYDTDLSGINFPEVIKVNYPDLDEDTKYNLFRHGDYDFADMTGCVFSTHNRNPLSFSHSTFMQTNLTDAIFEYAYLDDCKFISTKLHNANFGVSNIVDCLFDDAELNNAILTGAQVELNEFYNCDIANTDLRGTNFISNSFEMMKNCIVVHLTELTIIAIKNSDNSIFINTRYFDGSYDEASEYFYNENLYINKDLVLKTLQFIKESLLMY